MVVEPAGFLAFHDRCFELDAVFFQGHPLRYQTEDGFDVTLKAFCIAGCRVVLEQDAAWLEHLNQRCNHVVFVAFHGGRGQLHHQNVAETVNHQAWQHVGIAVHQTVVRLVEQTVTQGQGHVEAVNQQRLVQGQLDVTRQHARADQVVRAHGHDAQRLATCGFEQRLVTGFKAVKRGGGYINFVAVDPQVAGAQASIGIGFKAQAWQGHEVAPGIEKGAIIALDAACKLG